VGSSVTTISEGGLRIAGGVEEGGSEDEGGARRPVGVGVRKYFIYFVVRGTKYEVENGWWSQRREGQRGRGADKKLVGSE
jgi:hypothetical protein